MENYRFYKYAPLNAYTLSNLINRSIYFNHVSNFDDPTDSAFRILIGDEAIDRKNLSKDNIKKLFKFMRVSYTHNDEKQEPSLTLMRVCDQLEKALKRLHWSLLFYKTYFMSQM